MRDRRLAGLAVAQDQLALAAADGNQRIDDLQAGLQRHRDRRAVHDGRGGPFDGQAIRGVQGAAAVERPAERVDDAAQQGIAHRHVHHAAFAFDLVARVQVRMVAEQHDVDLVFVDVEGDAAQAAGKTDQFLEADAGQAADRGDARGDRGDRAHLARDQLRLEPLSRLAQAREGVIEDALQARG